MLESQLTLCTRSRDGESVSGYCVWSCVLFKDSVAQTVIPFSSYVPAQFSHHETGLGLISIRSRLGHRSTSSCDHSARVQCKYSTRFILVLVGGFSTMTAFCEQYKYTLEYIKHIHRIHEILYCKKTQSATSD